MLGRTSPLKATALALPLGLAAAAAHAADIAEAAKQNSELSRFSEAIAAAGLDEQLAGKGPFTVFAPTNRAFERLPEGALDELMRSENRAQLTKLLEHHMVQGEAITADDALGKQTKVETMSGDPLTLDGTSAAVLLVPTGLTIVQAGDQLVIEREGVVVSTHAIEVEEEAAATAGDERQQAASQQTREELAAATTPTSEPSGMPVTKHQQEVLRSHPGQEQQQTAPAGASPMPETEHQRQVLTEGEEGQQQGQSAASTPTAEESGMPVTKHQQEVLRSHPGQEQQQTAPAGASPMPDTEHQRQVLSERQEGQQQGQSAASTPTAEESGMPITEHQQEVLRTHPAQEQQQTAPTGATPMPETEHQRQALAEEELPGEQQQAHEQGRVQGKPDVQREAAVIEPEIQADNGVILVIDTVLVPQSLVETLQGAGRRG